MRNTALLLPALLVAFGTTNAPAADPPSRSIAVDQAGYLTGAPKFAIVIANEKKPLTSFTVRDSATGAVAFSGTLGAGRADADSGDFVQSADFSALDKAGTYYLDVPGAGRSFAFAIGKDVYRRAYYLAMRSYYGQRCGFAVDLGAEFPGYKHDICHQTGAYHASSGKDGPAPSHNGWHDAGDYGRYVVNSGISTGTLLWTWELFSTQVENVKLALPDSRAPVPDILTEIRWNLDWMLSMQDSDGGVWHKQTSDHFPAFIAPEKDTLTSYIIGAGKAPYKSSCATADFAAVMAIAARVYAPYDGAYARLVRQSAESAWSWLEHNPSVLFHNPAGVSTGDYGDQHCSDEHLWAAAELSRTTFGANYHDYVRTHYHDFIDTIRPDAPPTWSDVAPLALWTYALARRGDQEAITAIVDRSTQAANGIAARAAQNGYRIPLTSRDYIWGSNGVLANYALQLLVADRLHPDARYRQAAWESLHYLFGRNTFSLSFVTQVGENAVLHPHHRPSVATGLPKPWPGLLSGGPNRARQDAAMQKQLQAGLPPARNFIDVTEAYACNEVAINWNAPLVFVLAATLPE